MSNALVVRDRISRAIIGMLRNDPFFANIVMCHQFSESKTGGVTINGKTLAYNPEEIEKLNDEQLKTVLVKSALKIATGQHLRVEGYCDRELLSDNPIKDGEVLNLMNEAGDLSIDSMLVDRAMPEGWPMPTQGRYQNLEHNHPMEYYFEALRAQYIPPPEGDDGGGKGDEGQDNPQTATGNGDDQTPSGGQNEASTGKPDPSNGKSGTPNRGQCPVDMAPNPDIQDDDPNSQSKAEQEWMTMVASAAMQAEQAGKLPAWVKEMCDSILKPAELSWRERLRRFAKKHIPFGSRSYARPNRRQAWRRDVMTASSVGKTVERVVWITDTSGSMSTESCNKGLKEMKDIMCQFPHAKLTHLQCDTRVASEVTWGRGDKMEVEKFAHSPTWAGRGGTDMIPAFARAMELKPQCIVCLTDGYFCYPDKIAVPTLWLMVNDNTAPWGETVRMKDGDE